MAHGLEVRSPFLRYHAHRARDATAPSSQAPRRGVLSVKQVLKRTVAGLLPDGILSRPNQKFRRPLNHWFRGELASYTAAMLGPQAHLRRRLNGAELDRMLAEHNMRAQNHGHALWTLLTLELFLRRHGW